MVLRCFSVFLLPLEPLEPDLEIQSLVQIQEAQCLEAGRTVCRRWNKTTCTHLNPALKTRAQAREARCLEAGSSVDLQRRIFRSSGVRALEAQPDYLLGTGKLRDYQLDGLNWMVYSWSNDHNCILADEVRAGCSAGWVVGLHRAM